MKITTSTKIAGSSMAAALILSSGAIAQDATQQGANTVRLEEIVVTAERRTTNIQDTPLVISAITSAEIERQPLTDMIQLGQRAPSLVFTHRQGVLQTAIRGISGSDFGLGADSRVAFHTDGIYTARGAAQTAALFDVERMEIVQGPQGVLYGRNATAGAVNVITRAPGDEFSGYFNQTFGNYDLYKTDAAVDLPVNEQLSFRLATQITDRGGYGKNIYLGHDNDDHDSEAYRARMRWSGERLQIDWTSDYFERQDQAYAINYQGWIRTPLTPNPPPYINSNTVLPTDHRDSSNDIKPEFAIRTYGHTLKVGWELSDNLTVQSLTGYRKTDYFQSADADATNIVANAGTGEEVSKSYSQEFQVTGDYGSTRFTAGLYGFDEEIDIITNITTSTVFPGVAGVFIAAGLPVPPPTQYIAGNMGGAKFKTRAYAVFGSVTQDLTDRLRLTVGGRYTWEEKEASRGRLGINSVPVTGAGADFHLPSQFYGPWEDESWTKFTPQVTLQYDVSADAMVYLTYAVGFKSGSYGPGDSNPPVDPEVLDDIEAGLKATWMDGRLRTNLSAFYYKYDDLQVSSPDFVAGGLRVQNAAEATAYGVGFDAEFQATDRLHLKLESLFLRSTYDEFQSIDASQPLLGIMDLSGNDLQQAPNYKITGAINYTIPVGHDNLSFHLQATTTDDFHTSPFNHKETAAPSNTLVDASVRYDMSNGFMISFWANNLTDKTQVIGISPGNLTTGNPLNVSYGPPRTYGATIGYKW